MPVKLAKKLRSVTPFAWHFFHYWISLVHLYKTVDVAILISQLCDYLIPFHHYLCYSFVHFPTGLVWNSGAVKMKRFCPQLIWHEYWKRLWPKMWSAALTNLNTFYFKFYSCFISIHKRTSRTGCRAPFELRSVTLDISSLITFSKVMFCELICLIWKVFDP